MWPLLDPLAQLPAKCCRRVWSAEPPPPHLFPPPQKVSVLTPGLWALAGFTRKGKLMDAAANEPPRSREVSLGQLRRLSVITRSSKD